MSTQEAKAELEYQEFEVSDVSDQIPDSPKDSEITEVEEETQLEDYEKALGKSVTKAQISKGSSFYSLIFFLSPEARG